MHTELNWATCATKLLDVALNHSQPVNFKVHPVFLLGNGAVAGYRLVFAGR